MQNLLRTNILKPRIFPKITKIIQLKMFIGHIWRKEEVWERSLKSDLQNAQFFGDGLVPGSIDKEEY